MLYLQLSTDVIWFHINYKDELFRRSNFKIYQRNFKAKRTLHFSVINVQPDMASKGTSSTSIEHASSYTHNLSTKFKKEIQLYSVNIEPIINCTMCNEMFGLQRTLRSRKFSLSRDPLVPLPLAVWDLSRNCEKPFVTQKSFV